MREGPRGWVHIPSQLGVHTLKVRCTLRGATLAASMLGLSHAVRTIPLGTAYAVWVGIGAALTVAWGVASGAESFSWAKVLLIAGLVACVVGLKLVGEGH